MLNEKNQRELAYLVTVDEIREIPGYDRICQYRTGGWWCVSGKGDYQVGDIALYIEIDSLCPYTNEFAFLNEAFNEEGVKVRPDRHKIKTQKFAKGTAISQGLLCPLKDFPKLQGKPVGYFCTEQLGITYYEAEDNKRKADYSKYTSMQARHKKFFKTKLGKWLMKREWGRKLCFFFLGKKKDKKTDWPAWVVKTDEERCQNCFDSMKKLPYDYWIATEKIDGTSTTFTMKQAPAKKRELIVCSRNVVYNAPEKEDRNYYKDSDGNVYLEMAKTYDMYNVLSKYLDSNQNLEYVTIQGETYGGTIQKRNYGKEHRLAIFNIIYKEKGLPPVRLNPYEMAEMLPVLQTPNGMTLRHVPILGDVVLPETCDDLLASAGGASHIDGGMREGIVLRTADGRHSFKAVDNEFLLVYHS